MKWAGSFVEMFLDWMMIKYINERNGDISLYVRAL